MHICFSCIEFFGAGIQGGFGRATRFLGRELARRGVTVSVIVPRRGDLQCDSAANVKYQRLAEVGLSRARNEALSESTTDIADRPGNGPFHCTGDCGFTVRATTHSVRFRRCADG